MRKKPLIPSAPELSSTPNALPPAAKDPDFHLLQKTYGAALASKLIGARRRIEPILARRGVAPSGALPSRALKDRETLQRWLSGLLSEVTQYLPDCSLVGMSIRAHKPLSTTVACARDDAQYQLATVLAGVSLGLEHLHDEVPATNVPPRW